MASQHPTLPSPSLLRSNSIEDVEALPTYSSSIGPRAARAVPSPYDHLAPEAGRDSHIRDRHGGSSSSTSSRGSFRRPLPQIPSAEGSQQINLKPWHIRQQQEQESQHRSKTLPTPGLVAVQQANNQQTETGSVGGVENPNLHVQTTTGLLSPVDLRNDCPGLEGGPSRLRLECPSSQIPSSPIWSQSPCTIDSPRNGDPDLLEAPHWPSSLYSKPTFSARGSTNTNVESEDYDSFPPQILQGFDSHNSQSGASLSPSDPGLSLPDSGSDLSSLFPIPSPPPNLPQISQNQMGTPGRQAEYPTRSLAPHPFCPLSSLFCLPQISTGVNSPFSRGYTPGSSMSADGETEPIKGGLQTAGVEKANWLRFLDGLNVAMVVGPPRNVINTAGGWGLGFSPYHWRSLASSARHNTDLSPSRGPLSRRSSQPSSSTKRTPSLPFGRTSSVSSTLKRNASASSYPLERSTNISPTSPATGASQQSENTEGESQQSRTSTDKYLKRANLYYFQPRGLVVRLVTTPALKRIIQLRIEYLEQERRLKETVGIPGSGNRGGLKSSKFLTSALNLSKGVENVVLSLPMPLTHELINMIQEPPPSVSGDLNKVNGGDALARRRVEDLRTWGVKKNLGEGEKGTNGEWERILQVDFDNVPKSEIFDVNVCDFDDTSSSNLNGDADDLGILNEKLKPVDVVALRAWMENKRNRRVNKKRAELERIRKNQRKNGAYQGSTIDPSQGPVESKSSSNSFINRMSSLSQEWQAHNLGHHVKIHDRKEFNRTDMLIWVVVLNKSEDEVLIPEKDRSVGDGVWETEVVEEDIKGEK